LNLITNVAAGDILSITSATNPDLEKDYRVLEKVTDNSLRLEYFFMETGSSVEYIIHKSEIMNGQTVKVQFDYNPLAIDIGNKIQLDDYGRIRGVRPGREEQTIDDLVFLDIKQIELVDPITGESLDTVLNSLGGYGSGGYGRGGYGRGSGSDFFLIVNKPNLRYSAWEDSLIVIRPFYQAQSFKVTYRFDPEILSYQTFADSDRERVLDAHVLMKHFMPGYVSFEAEYSIDPEDPEPPTEEEVLSTVRESITNIKSGVEIDVSDIIQSILSSVDPTGSGRARVRVPFYVNAIIHGTNGTITKLRSNDKLAVPVTTLPSDTDNPVTARLVHWIPDNIVLTRV